MSSVALTTTFTPPASCFNNVYTSVGNSIFEKDVSITSAQCYPSSFQSWFAAGVPYSPGVCPSGYSYGSEASYKGGATAALCCPSGMSAYPAGLGCSLQISAPTVLEVDSGRTTVTDGALAVHGIYIAWASGQQSPLQPASSVSSSVPLSTSVSTTSKSTSQSTRSASTSRKTHHIISTTHAASSGNHVTAAASPTEAKHTVFVTRTSSPQKGLSVGEQAGIGVGVGIVGLALVLAGVWALLRRRKQRTSSASELNNGDFQEKKVGQQRAEKRHISELSSDGAISELGASS